MARHGCIHIQLPKDAAVEENQGEAIAHVKSELWRMTDSVSCRTTANIQEACEADVRTPLRPFKPPE